MQVVGPRLADLPVMHGYLDPGLRPVRGTLLLAGQCPLGPREFPFPVPQVAGVGDQHRRRSGGQHAQPEVQAHVAITAGAGRRYLHHERGVIAAVRLADDRDAGRRGWQRTGPADLQVADLRRVEPVPCKANPLRVSRTDCR